LIAAETSEVSSRVEELMSTLDQVKKYKELARSMGDFAIIILVSVIGSLFVYIGGDLYLAQGGQLPNGLILSGVESLIAILIFAAGLIAGILWVDRRVKEVKLGEWKQSLSEGLQGALKIISALDWPSVFQDIRYSKLGFVFYSVLKVFGYWILVSILLVFFDTFLVEGLLHAQLSLAYVGIVSLIIVLVLSRKDLLKRYNDSWALDSLLWELRWFDSEFRAKAEFGSGELTTKA